MEMAARSNPHGCKNARSSSTQPPTPFLERSNVDSRVICIVSGRAMCARSDSLSSNPSRAVAGSTATRFLDPRILGLELAGEDVLAGPRPAELLDVLAVHF